MTNRLGAPVGYKLLPQGTPTMLAHADSPQARRAAFAKHNLWVTALRRRRLARRGRVHEPPPGWRRAPGLRGADRSLDNTDLVVWHTFGLTHVPRPEDWPVMPVEYCGFVLQPVGFFERNPTLDVPPTDHCT